MRTKAKADPVRPELREYVIGRDRGCVVGRLLRESPKVGLCRAPDGHQIAWWTIRDLTIAHVRDRGLGGRLGKRPPSTPRHLVAACHGHHLAEPIVDLAFVRDELDRYLEEREGPEPPSDRPWEVIARIRGRS